MAKKQQHSKRGQAKEHPWRGERTLNSTTAEVVTVAWMLSSLAALVAEILGLSIRVIAVRLGESDRLEVLASTLLLTAFVAGLLTLTLTPVTFRLRRTPPPRPIVVAALVVGSVPVLTVILLALRA